VRSVADPHHLEADPNPAFHFDEAPDPDSTFHSERDLDLPLKLNLMRIRILPLAFSRFGPSNAPK
jgi:hypothetical protein